MTRAPVAQLDRVLASEAKGQRFESSRAHQAIPGKDSISLMKPQLVRIASRRSPLALQQADIVAHQLSQHHRHLKIDIVPFTTQGDKILDQPLSKIGGKGLFVKELERALLDEHADIAVHSAKDLPTTFPDGLYLGAVCERDDPRDALVSPHLSHVHELNHGATVGTSSLRRQCQLANHYPDLHFQSLRGNVQTRLKKLDDGRYDAIILAAAGLKRLNLTDRITAYFDPAICLPAIGQGTLAIECRRDDANIKALIQPLEHAPSRICLTAERAFNQGLNGSCQIPIAGYATLDACDGNTTLKLNGLVGKPDGAIILHDSICGKPTQATQLGMALAERLIAQGAQDIINTCVNNSS